MSLWIISCIIPIIMVVSIVIQLSGHRKDKYQRLVHSIFYRTQRPGAGAWGLGPWYYGAWDVGEKLNESIAQGQDRSSHQRSYRRSNRRRPHRRHH
jgi:hypothetical protein